MSELRDAFCKSVKDRYPEIAAKADAEYERLWGDFTDSEYYSYSWFEALANALNKAMIQGVPASEHSQLLSLIGTHFDLGAEDVRNCIDVAFVENLFWQVPPAKAAGYWAVLPENLKGLYVDFHRQDPL